MKVLQLGWLNENQGVRLAIASVWLFCFISIPKVFLDRQLFANYAIFFWLGSFAILYLASYGANSYFSKQTYTKPVLKKINQWGWIIWTIFVLSTFGVLIVVEGI